jgi:hypothetical protein
MSEEKKPTFFDRLRRVRLLVVLLTSGLVVFAGLLLTVYLERDLLRGMTESELRYYLERDAGLNFHMAGSRLHLFPLKVSFDGITLNRSDEPWVLSADAVEIDISLYSLFFQKGGVARARIVRPRFLQRIDPTFGEGAGESTARKARKGLLDIASLLSSGLPFRELEVEEGTVQVTEGGERTLFLEGVRLAAFLSGGRLVTDLGFRDGAFRHRGADWELGEVSLNAVLDGAGANITSFTFRSPLLDGKISGSVDYLGAMELKGSVTGRIGGITERLGLGRKLDGSLSFTGDAGGTVNKPHLSGRVALMKPLFRGERWPSVKGTVDFDDGVLTWEDLVAAVERGKLRSSGNVDFRGALPRYDVRADVKELEPQYLPGASGPVGSVGPVSGRLTWSGEGFREEDLSGAGSLEARLLVRGWEPGEITLAAEAALDGPFLEVMRLDAGSGAAALHALGVWRLGGDFAAWVRGDSGDLAALSSHWGIEDLSRWGIEDLGGRISLQGEVSSSPSGVRFDGPLRWEGGRAFNLRGLDLEANVSADRERISLSNGLVRWMGARIKADGSVMIPERQVDLLTTWEDLAAGKVASAFGLDADVDGSISLEGRLLGDWGSPTLSGRFQAENLRYGDVIVERAGGNLSYAAGRLKLSEIAVGSGTSMLSFTGEVDKRRLLTGTFKSSEFDLKDFLPTTTADVVGVIEGQLLGTLEKPVVTGGYEANTMDYENWSFKEARGSFEYRDGAFTLEGILAERENRYLLRVEPRGGWPFKVSLSLGHFSPELAREGFPGMPDKLKESLKGFSFLAVGEFLAEGDLKDRESISASLSMETIWVYTEAQTLQNATPLRFTWVAGEFSVSEFTLVGEDYRISLSGRGSREEGWNLALDGEVNLAIFQNLWRELEEVDAPGSVHLTLKGPWDTPEVGGKIGFRGGSLKLRSLPEPVHDISGEGELAGNSIVLTDFSGRMGDGAFIAGGAYDFDTDHVNLFVEGRLDLALFERRVPGAREMSGPVEVSISLSGTSSRPEILGEARLEGAEIFLLPMPEKISDLTGSVLVEEGRVVLSGLEGRMGSGSLSLGGEIDWRQEPVKVDLALSGRKIVFVVPEIAKALINTDLALSGDFESPKLSGKVDFLKARYFREFKDKITNVPGFSPGGEEAQEKARSVGPDWDAMALDIWVNAADRFWISNSMAELENSVSLHVGGTVKDPDLDGEVNLLRGEVTYFNRRFELFSGRIFNVSPGINPILEAQAEVSVGSTRIYLLLEGPLHKPTLQLTSVPPYSQEDLFALLTVGYTRSSLEEQKGESLAIGAAIVLSTPVIEQIKEGAQEVTGIEIFQVEPSFGEEAGTARVIVGTQLSDRLYMSASQSIGVTEEQQVRLEYQLHDHFSVLGQQLRQGIYAFDLVFSRDFH